MGFQPPIILSGTSFPNCHNHRNYADGTIQPRPGLARIANVAGPVHSLFRLNNSTPPAVNPAIRVIGAGSHLFWGTPGSLVYTDLGGGWSGNPLVAHPGQPPQSPEPWLYVVDSAQMLKINVAGTTYNIGINPPIDPPTLTVDAPLVTVIDDFEVVGQWGTAGGGIAPVGVSTFARINTTIVAIAYDNGNTGYASIAPATMDQIGIGCRVILAGVETVTVTDILPSVAATTIQGILYDNGAGPGPCTIQPLGSLGTGQQQAATHGDVVGIISNAPTIPSVQTALVPIRVVDYPIHALITLGGTEVVQITSVAVGLDGQLSFRCVTNAVHAANETLTGLNGFRAAPTTTRVVNETIIDFALQNTLTSTGSVAAGTLPFTAGIQAGQGVITSNLAFIGGTRAAQPNDEFHFSIRVDNLQSVTAVRLIFDVDLASSQGTKPPFTQNYFFFEWDANALIQAIQAGALAVSTTIPNAQLLELINGQLVPVPPGQQPQPGVTTVNPNVLQSVGALGTGSNQWIELRVPLSKLIRVGSDASRTLANTWGVGILLSANGIVPLQVSYDALYLTGGFGPDVGDIGDPYHYRFRYRSKAGVTSGWSPATLNGVVPRRQRVRVTMASSLDPQAVKFDVARIGGALPGWTYVSTADTSPFLDDLGDDDIVGGEPIVFTDLPPWPITDIPRSGVCNVVGTSVQYVSGDPFYFRWAPGASILVNGRVATLWRTPTAGQNILFVNENVGVGTNVPYAIPNATIFGQPLPTLWGDYLGYHFAVGDVWNPGTLYWTNHDSLDTASDANTLIVSNDQASEPLMNGFIWDAAPYVFSTQDLYRIVPTPGGVSIFDKQQTACGRGLWARTAFCVQPEGIYFVTKDGIGVTAGGTPAQMITAGSDPDLRLLFPHDGQPGQAVTVGSVVIQPPDMTNKMALTGIDGLIYFDYYDTTGAPNTLVFDPVGAQWLLDRYSVGVQSRYLEEGNGVHAMLVGGDNGIAYQAMGGTDDGMSIPMLWATAPTTHGNPGLFSVHDIFLAHQSLADLQLVIAYDGLPFQYTVPNSGGAYQRVYSLLAANKGSAVVYGLSSSQPFRIFRNETVARVQAWGSPNGYVAVQPFGGGSRRDGAAV